jgi:ORF6N domain
MPAKKKTPSKKAASAPVGGLLIPEKIAPLVHVLRHEKVILDSDLAELYGVETGHLNRAVQRNIERFPPDFMFQVTEDELEILRSQIAISKNAESVLRCQIGIAKNAQSPLRSQPVTLKAKHGGRRTLPYVFTEQGVAMLSSVLRSPRAVEVNIAIMRTFVQLRRLMDSNALLAEKIEALEAKYAEHDQHFEVVFEAIKQLIATPVPPSREIGFHTR